MKKISILFVITLLILSCSKEEFLTCEKRMISEFHIDFPDDESLPGCEKSLLLYKNEGEKWFKVSDPCTKIYYIPKNCKDEWYCSDPNEMSTHFSNFTLIKVLAKQK